MLDSRRQFLTVNPLVALHPDAQGNVWAAPPTFMHSRQTFANAASALRYSSSTKSNCALMSSKYG